ncbi:HK97-gp10 family putative phage morphogenesis protein [Bacillus sp. FSL W7-1360]
MARIEIRGADKLIGRLKKGNDLSDVRRVIARNTAEMQAKTQREAPYRYGDLKRDVKQDITDSGMCGKVSSTAPYAPYQEYGTRFQSGKPHVRPAFHSQKGKFINDMKNLMK